MSISFETVSTIGGFLGVTGTVFAFFLYQLRKNDLQLLRDSIKDLSDRVVFLEKENTRLKVDFADAKFKKNYLKQIVLEALANKADIKDMLQKSLENHNSNG